MRYRLMIKLTGSQNRSIKTPIPSLPKGQQVVMTSPNGQRPFFRLPFYWTIRAPQGLATGATRHMSVFPTSIPRTHRHPRWGLTDLTVAAVACQNQGRIAWARRSGAVPPSCCSRRLGFAGVFGVVRNGGVFDHRDSIPAFIISSGATRLGPRIEKRIRQQGPPSCRL